MNDKFFIQCSLSAYKGEGRRCRWCNKKLVGRQRRWCSGKCSNLAYVNHRFSAGSKAAKRRDKFRCVRCDAHKRDVKIETNHIIPALGTHKQISCLHHLENLEVLCIPCHRKETAKQRKERNSGKNSVIS